MRERKEKAETGGGETVVQLSGHFLADGEKGREIKTSRDKREGEGDRTEVGEDLTAAHFGVGWGLPSLLLVTSRNPKCFLAKNCNHWL